MELELVENLVFGKVPLTPFFRTPPLFLNFTLILVQGYSPALAKNQSFRAVFIDTLCTWFSAFMIEPQEGFVCMNLPPLYMSIIIRYQLSLNNH